jgi:hypothetical protein
MKTQTWYVRKEEKIIYPEDLKKNPDEHGGLGIHMMCAINDKVITIPLKDNDGDGGGGCVSIQVTDKKVAKRIEKEGKVDILSKGYWVDINNTTPVFFGTKEPIPMWGQTVGDSLASLGLI